MDLLGILWSGTMLLSILSLAIGWIFSMAIVVFLVATNQRWD